MGAPSKRERDWAMFTHLAAFVGFLIPFGNIVGPLVVWLLKKDEMPFVNDQGKEALNFQITLMVAALIAVVLCFLVIGFLLLPVIAIAGIVLPIVGAIRASEGRLYRYPYALRLID
jgi:hypothetical protein